MTAKAAKYDLVIQQGASFFTTMRWFGDGIEYKEINSIEAGAPTILTVTGHGMSSNHVTPVFISGVTGAPQLNNSITNALNATYVDANRFSVNVDTIKNNPVNGVVTYPKSVDLSSYSARMQIRERKDSADILLELTTDNGRLLLGTEGAITFNVEADDTAALDFDCAVYDLELIEPLPSTKVIRLIEGEITLSKEVTQ